MYMTHHEKHLETLKHFFLINSFPLKKNKFKSSFGSVDHSPKKFTAWYFLRLQEMLAEAGEKLRDDLGRLVHSLKLGFH